MRRGILLLKCAPPSLRVLQWSSWVNFFLFFVFLIAPHLRRLKYCFLLKTPARALIHYSCHRHRGPAVLHAWTCREPPDPVSICVPPFWSLLCLQHRLRSTMSIKFYWRSLHSHCVMKFLLSICVLSVPSAFSHRSATIHSGDPGHLAYLAWNSSGLSQRYCFVSHEEMLFRKFFSPSFQVLLQVCAHKRLSLSSDCALLAVWSDETSLIFKWRDWHTHVLFLRRHAFNRWSGKSFSKRSFEHLFSWLQPSMVTLHEILCYAAT